MTPIDLRALAAYHAESAAKFRACAAGMRQCPVAAQFQSDAARHDQWAAQLTELADSFYAFAANQ